MDELQELRKKNQILEEENSRLQDDLTTIKTQLSQYKMVSESLQSALKEKEELLSQLMSANESLCSDIKCLKELNHVRAETPGNCLDMNGHIPIHANGGEPEQFRKLFIGGLNYDTTEEGMKTHFEQWGEVSHCVIMCDTAKKSRGFGFIVYKKAQMVDEAQNHRPHIIDRRQVDTKRAVSKEESSNPESHMRIKKIFVGGLNQETEEENLRVYFEQFGNVENIEILLDRETKKKRGFAFVFFNDHDPVDKLVLMKHHVINGTRCEVKKAISKHEMKQRGTASGPPSGGQSGPPQPTQGGPPPGPASCPPPGPPPRPPQGGWPSNFPVSPSMSLNPNNTSSGPMRNNNNINSPNSSSHPNNINNNNPGGNNPGSNTPTRPPNSNWWGDYSAWTLFGANYSNNNSCGPVRTAHPQRSPGPYGHFSSLTGETG